MEMYITRKHENLVQYSQLKYVAQIMRTYIHIGT